MTQANPQGAFDYEVEMYFEARARLKKRPKDPILHNALLESALLHTRILADTLIATEPKYKDDVTLRMILPQTERPESLEVVLAALRDTYGDPKCEGTPCYVLNKYLAHLTKDRGLRYDYGPALRRLEPVLEEGLREVARCIKSEILARYLSV